MTDPKGFPLRLRYGKGQQKIFYLQSEHFKDRMAAMAASLMRAGKVEDAPIVLKHAAAQKTEKGFSAIEERCRQICAQGPIDKSRPKTFQDVADLWMNGTLHRRYPDLRGSRIEDKYLEKVRSICTAIHPLIGDALLSSITKEQCLEVKAKATAGHGQSSRSVYAIVIRKVLSFAEDPLELIPRSPVPKDFVPHKGKPPGFSFLYPEEDRALLEHADIPLLERLLYGFLVRTGLRKSAALGLTGGNVDLHRGVLTVIGKGGKERFFRMEPDVVRALVAFFGGTRPSGLLFPDISGTHLALRLQEHAAAALLAANLHRPELFGTTPKRRQLRVHDLRATFVTLWLAMGKSERCVMDRTGHANSSELARYNRGARHAGELDLGPPHPLDECLGLTSRPGLVRSRVSQRVSQNGTGGHDLGPSPRSRASAEGVQEPAHTPKTPEKRTGANRKKRADSPQNPRVSQNLTVQQEQDDMSVDVEKELALALRRASKAGEWETVNLISKELTERRRERAGNVVEIGSARRKT